MALVVEITVKINCSYPNLSEISPDIIVLHLFQELFLQGMTFSHSLPCKYKTVNRIHIPFPFIGELFFQRMKSQKKNNENNSNSIYNLYAMYNLNIFFDHHLLLSSKFQSLETFTHRNKIVTKLARNLDEESHSRLRASRKQTWAEGVVDKAVEISGRIIGVRLNWLDRGSDGKIQRRNFSPSRVYILNRGGGENCVSRDYSRKIYAFLVHHPFLPPLPWTFEGKKKRKGEEEEEEFALMHIARKNRPRI